jgi:hypothetical protein
VADSALVAHALGVHIAVALLLRLIGLRRLTIWLARVAGTGSCGAALSASAPVGSSGATARPSRSAQPEGWQGREPRAEALRHEDRVVWAVRTATHLVPAGRTCLTEALTAQHLLRRHGGDALLRFGVSACKVSDTRDPAGRVSDTLSDISQAPIAAHAWLEAAGRIIIGGDTAAQYQPMAARKEMP